MEIVESLSNKTDNHVEDLKTQKLKDQFKTIEDATKKI